MVQDLSAEWYEPESVIAEFERNYGGDARTLIVDNLRDGKIRCRAERSWKTDDKHYREAWAAREAHLEKASIDIDIPIGDWRKGDDLYRDARNWIWAEGRFFVNQWISGKNQLVFYIGVKFYGDDIRTLLSNAKNRGGRKPRYDQWGYLCCALIEMDRNNGLNLEEFPSKAKLMSGVLDVIRNELGQDHPLSVESLEPALTPVFDRFCRKPPTSTAP